MSLDIVRKNSNSPFHLQRSIVDQGGSGGVYEQGGFDPNNVYSDGGIAESIAGFGKIVGAGLSNITAADKNTSDVNRKERLEKKETRLTEKRKGQTGMEDVSSNISLDKKIARNRSKIETTGAKIKAYNEIEKPTLKSDIVGKTTPVTVNSKVTTKPPEESTSNNDWINNILGFNKKNILNKTIQ